MQLSYSQIWTYSACPRRYAYRFVDKLADSISWQAGFGTSVHNALYKFIQEIRGPYLWKQLGDFHPGMQQDLFASPTKETTPTPHLERLIELLDLSWVSHGYEGSEHMYAQKAEAITILEQWFALHAKAIPNIMAVELSFKIPLGDVTLTGRFDRIDVRDGSIQVIDYKSGKKRSQEEVNKDTQLALYAYVIQQELNRDEVDLGLYFLRDNSIVETTMSRAQTQPFYELVMHTAEQIQLQNFAPTPSITTCSHCPYRSICDQAVIEE